MATGYTPQTWAQIRQTILQQFQSNLVTANVAPPADVPGSQVNALLNAAATVVFQQQQQLSAVQTIARLGTSSGADIDSFVYPFGISRLSATYATGAVTLGFPSAVPAQTVIPLGAVVAASNGVLFTVIVDTTNASYSAALGGYVIPSGQSSVTVTVQCQTAGTVGNVGAGTINTVYSSSSTPALSGISLVSNASGFTSAINTETDAQLAARFTAAMSAGRVGTGTAIAAAVLGVQAGLTYSVCDGYLAQVLAPQPTPLSTSAGGTQAARNAYVRTTYLGSGGETLGSAEFSIAVPANSVVTVQSPPPMAGAASYNVYAANTASAETKQTTSGIAIGTNWTEPTTGFTTGGASVPTANTTSANTGVPGWTTVFVAVQGSGTGPSSTLQNNVQAAVNAVRSAGSSVPVRPPSLVTVSCTATVKVGPTGIATTVQPLAASAISAYLNGIGLDPAGNATLAQLGALYSLLLQIPGVSGVPSLTLNGAQADVSAPLGSMIVAGTITVTTA